MSVEALLRRAKELVGERGLARPGLEAALDRGAEGSWASLVHEVAVEAGLAEAAVAARGAAAILFLAAVRLARDLAAATPAVADRAPALQAILGHTAVEAAQEAGADGPALALASRSLAGLSAWSESGDAETWTVDRYLAEADRSAAAPLGACLGLVLSGSALSDRAIALGRAAGLVASVADDLASEPRRWTGLPGTTADAVLETVRVERAVLLASGVRAFEAFARGLSLEHAQPPPAPPDGTGEILIAEDDAILARALARRLASSYGTRVVSNIAEVRKLRAEGRSWIGAIIDIRLPDGSGLDLLESLRCDGWDRPALVLTGHLAPELINRAATLGASYVVKPAPDEILSRFTSEVGRGDRNVAAVLASFGERHRLTPGERRVLELSVRGVSREAIADEIGVSENTLKTQVRSMLAKIPGAFQLGDVTRRIWSDALGAEKEKEKDRR